VTGKGVVQQRAQSNLMWLRLAGRGIPADDRIRHGAELEPCFRFGDGPRAGGAGVTELAMIAFIEDRAACLW